MSAVENGKKNVPKDLVGKLTSVYQLSSGEKDELEEAVEESKMQYKIKVNNTSRNKRKVAMQFARSFDDIDEETAEKILEILTRSKED